MSRYEDIKKKRNTETQEVKQSSPTSRYQSIKANRGERSYGVDTTYINTFIQDAQKFLKSSQEERNLLNWQKANDKETSENRNGAIADLNSRSATIRAYLNANKSKLDEDTYKELVSTLDSVKSATNEVFHSFHNAEKYYSQWETEDDYNKAVDAQKDREEKSTFDLDAGAKEIEELEAIFDDAYTVESWYNAYQMNPGAWDAQTVSENMAKYNALIEKYESLDELDSLIQNKKQYLNQAAYIQEGIALAGVAGNDDFTEFSGYVSTKNDSFWTGLTSEYGLGYGDLTYEYINNNSGIRDEIKRSHTNFSRGHGGSDGESIYEEKGYDFLEEDEIAIYNYYYAKEGKEAAERYLHSIQETLNARKAGAVFAPLEGNTALELLFGIEAGLDQFKSGIKNLFNTDDDYIPSSATQMASAMVRGDLADDSIPVWYNFKEGKWEDKILGSSVGQMAYDTVTTSANMVPSILTSLAIDMVAPGVGSWVGSGMIGASAAGNAYQQALNEGFSKEQARGYSLLVGTSEVVMEKVLGGISAFGGNALGKYFVKNVGAADTALKMIAKRLGGSIISEFSEEYLQEVLNPVFRNMALGTDEEVKLFSADALYAGILGALTAGIMEGPGIAYSETKTNNTGKRLKAAGISSDRLAELGKTFSADTVAYQLAGKVDENTGAYTIGRLFNEIGATMTEQNVTEITNALVAKGMDQVTAKKNAEVLAYVVEGGQLSESQVAIIEANDALAEAAKATLIDANTTWNQRSNSYKEVLQTLANEVASPKTPQTKQAQQSKENVPTADTVDIQEESGTKSLSEAESDYEVSVEGKTIDRNGNDIVITGVESVKDGKMILKTKTGTIDSSEVLYASKSDALIYEAVANLDASPASAWSMIKGWDKSSGVTAEEYAADLKLAYMYGKFNYAAGMKNLNTKSATAFQMGRADAEAEAKADQYTIDSTYQQAKEILKQKEQVSSRKYHAVAAKGVNEGSMNKQQKASFQLAKQIAPAVKAYIVAYEGGKEWGHYDHDTDTIHINVNAKWNRASMMAYTLGHELAHRAKKGSPAQFKAFADFLIEQYGKQGASVEAMIAEQMEAAKSAGIEMTEDQAFEEVVADACQLMLLDTNAGQKLALWGAESQQNKTFLEKIKQIITDLMDRLRAYFKGVDPDSLAAREFAKIDANAKQFLADMFVDMSIDAGEKLSTIKEVGLTEKITTDKGGVKRKSGMSDADIKAVQNIGRISVNQFSAADIKATERFAQQYWKEMGVKSPFFRAWFGDWRANDQTKVQIANKKGDTRGVQKNADTGWSVQVSGQVFAESKHFARKNKSAMPYLPYINDIVEKAVLLDSYGIDIGRAKSQNSLLMHSLYAVADIGQGPELLKLYVEEMNDPNAVDTAKRAYQLQNIEKASAVNGGDQGNTPSSLANTTNAICTVADLFAAVKRMDADFNPKTASKVVNWDGKPLEVYHGTTARFWAFNGGAYFTDDYMNADSYASGDRIVEVYLSMKDPLIIDCKGAKWDELDTKYGSSTQKIVGNANNGKFDGVIFENINDSWIDDAEYGDASTVYYPFKNTQIKSATDNIGTFDGSNPDIRYKVPVDAKSPSYEELVSKDPIAVIDVGRNEKGLSYADLKDQVLKNAQARKLFDVPHLNRDTDISIFLTPSSFTHAFSNLTADFGVDTILAMDHIDEIIHEAVLTHIDGPKNPAKAENRVFTFFAAITGENGNEPIKLKVKEYVESNVERLPRNIRNYFERIGEITTHNRLYDAVALEVVSVESAKKESGASASGTDSETQSVAKGTPNSIIKIADLLDIVNGDAKKYVPKAKTRDSNSYKLPVGEETSPRSLLANALEGVAKNEIEKQKIQEYKGKIDLVNTEEAKLGELNKQIKELSFAKGPRDTKAIRELQTEARKTANRINIYDKQLLRLEASKPLQDVLGREKKKAYKRAEQKGKQALEAYREKALAAQKELAEKWHESRKKGIDSRHRTAMRHKIKNVVNELNQYLLRGTKDRHVPIELQKAVAEALDAVNMDTVGAEERIAKLKDELLKAKTPEQIQEISRKIDHVQEMGDKMNDRLQKLKDAYDQFVNSDDPLIANSHDEVISNKLQSVIDGIGNTPLRDMTLSQLEDVYDMYRMVLTTIRNANKAFKAKKSESISAIASQVMAEVKKVGGNKKQSLAMFNGVKGFGWNNLKPVYAFEHIGSNHFTELFNNVRAGEDVWAVDVTEAREYYLDKSKKYNFNFWDAKKRYSFTSTSGMEFSLDLEQIMSLYAYSKRDQAADHLKKGGIVIDETTEVTAKNKLGIPVKFNPTEATAYNISDETLADIVGKLTIEQKNFVDEMQDYLSAVMGAKGNEVSLEMYGIKLFKEKFYFPLKSASQFMAKAKEQQQGDVKIKNSGFSKETVQKASNPIVLTPFMNVWANHVNEMSMYHAFVLPMEDFYRVYNYKTPTSETAATESVEMFIQNAYGKGATKYIDQLLKDLNGGARTDQTTGFINKMMGLFKKGAVFASLSVVVQQPSAIARAAALIDTKYFIGPKVDHKRHKVLWDEVKQYAPVAIIKEMGYFDTNMGKSTQDFILGKEYSGFSEKMKALVTDSNYRDEALSKAPALADEIAWCGIWEAVKREAKANNPGMDAKSEAFLEKVGERFTEIIVKTQVYDSVLSRSALMRSKDTGMKMATAFMAEPTTSINMVADALLQGKRGNRKYCRAAIGAGIASQILNSILVSFVYAGRDDDEDETYVEKFIGTLTGEILDSLNPATYIPFIKDIISIVNGYDVERSDMAVVSDLWSAIQNLKKDNVSSYRKVEGFAGSIAQIFGLPLKNIMRDARGIYQTIMSFVNGQQTTKAGIGYAVKGAITGKTDPNQQQLYEAHLSGDKAQIARVERRFKDQTAINTAIRKALRENDPRIKEAAVAKAGGDLDEYLRLAKAIIAEKRFSQDNVVAAINAEINALNKGETTTSAPKASGMFKAEDFAVAISQGDQAMANAIKTDIIQTSQKDGKSEEDAEKSFASSATSACKELFLTGDISESQAVNALKTYCGKTQSEAMSDVQYWAFKQDNPDVYADDQWFDTYYEKVASSGISIDVYMDYRNKVSSVTGEGKKERRMAVINSLPITRAQKDALYFAEGWTESKLYEAPWH